MVDIIAEFGSSPAPAWDFEKWCRAAAESGATHAKCQMFRADHFPVAERLSKKPLEFPRDGLAEFVRIAHNHGLKAGVSVFDDKAVELAAKHCDFLKLAAREQGNWDLVQMACDKAQSFDRPLYRSISNREYVREKIWLWFGGGQPPLRKTRFFTAQEYPRDGFGAIADVLYARFILGRTRWGYSSHTRGWLDCWLAAKLGAAVIEKHLCLSPDDIEAGHSLLPDAFRRMTRAINR